MNDHAKIFIVGTSHPLQCGTKKDADEQIQGLRSVIRRICEREGIKCIVEEMNSEGLANHEVQNTIPFEIAAELSIKHCYTDLTTEQLGCLCLSDGQIVQYSRSQPKRELTNQIRELLTEILLEPIRERYWLANILKMNTWPALFICGSDHGDSMKDLINSIGYGPVDSWCRYCPGERS